MKFYGYSTYQENSSVEYFETEEPELDINDYIHVVETLNDTKMVVSFNGPSNVSEYESDQASRAFIFCAVDNSSYTEDSEWHVIKADSPEVAAMKTNHEDEWYADDLVLVMYELKPEWLVYKVELVKTLVKTTQV